MRKDLTSDPNVDLTLGMETSILHATNRPVMLYLSSFIKFDPVVCFKVSLKQAMLQTEEWCDFNMPPEVPSGADEF